MPTPPPEAPAKPLVERLSPALFWDVDRDAVDETAHRRTIIQRVLERGSLNDWRAIRSTYTLPVIVSEAQQMRSLEPTALSFVACLGHVPEESFRSFTSKTTSPKHWV